MNTKLLPYPSNSLETTAHTFAENLPEVLFITSYPPRECGIATYSHDLITALDNKFENTFQWRVCALESDSEQHSYETPPQYILHTDKKNAFDKLAFQINRNPAIQLIVIQHEFGFFSANESDFERFAGSLNQPLIVVFHTVLPQPNTRLKQHIQHLVACAESVIVMTHHAAHILQSDYGVSILKITVIPHGTHLVPMANKELLKAKHQLSGKRVLSTFGLLSAGKGIETTLRALPSIVQAYPNVLFVIIGKTHPSVVKKEGEKYRSSLEELVKILHLEEQVLFVNRYLPVSEILEYLQLTDIYLFTSNDPNQAVSGTFSYAISCGCPIISTPIPHATELLTRDTGIIIDFNNSEQLSEATVKLFKNKRLRDNMRQNSLHLMAPTAWENSALAHVHLFQSVSRHAPQLHYRLPKINLNHVREMTTSFGIIQFSVISDPDIGSGYTLDDNARALVALCQHYALAPNEADLQLIEIYFHFIKHCIQPKGNFLNYVNEEKIFTEQNVMTNLEDANGRCIWALGHLIRIKELLPAYLSEEAERLIQRSVNHLTRIHSPRAISFAIKGLYYENNAEHTGLLILLTERLAALYRFEAQEDWSWFESYLTYGNSILPEAMLCAWLSTGNEEYKAIALESFDFLVSKIFTENGIQVISNKGWLHRGKKPEKIVLGGEQAIDVSYTIMALKKFYDVTGNPEYAVKMNTAFEWFLGNNHLNQIIYNPCTGGCYDGLEDHYINLNQGSESSLSYLMARLTLAQHFLDVAVETHRQSMKTAMDIETEETSLLVS